MASITEYRSRVSAPGTVSTAQSNGVSLGSGLRAIGQSVSEIGNTVSAYQKQDAQFQVQSDIIKAKTDLDAKWTQRTETYTYNPNAKKGETIVDYADQDHDEIKNNFLNQYDDGYKRQLFQREFDQVKASNFERAAVYDVNQKAKYEKNEYSNNANTIANRILANPTYLETGLKDMEKLTQHLTLGNPSDKKMMSDEVRKSFYGVAMEGYVSKLEGNPYASPGEIAALQAKIKDPKGPWIQNVNQKEFENYNKRLENLKVSTSDRLVLDGRAAFQNAVKVTGDGIPGSEKYTDQWVMSLPMGPNEKARALEEMAYARKVGESKSELKVMPVDKQAEQISKLESEMKKPENVDKYAENLKIVTALKEAHSGILDSAKKDKVAYIDSVSPNAKAAGDLFEKLLKQDEGKSVLSEETIKARTARIQAVEAEQKRLFPNEPVKLMSEKDIGEIKELVGAAQRSSNNAEQTLSALDRINIKWGDKSRYAISELVDANALTGPQALAAGIMQTPGMKQNALKLLNATLKAKDDQVFSKKVKTSLGASESALKEYLVTLDSYDDSARLRTDHIEAVAAMAAYDSTKSVKDITKELFTDRYVIKGKMRIPKDQNADDIETGASYIKNNIEKFGIAAVPPDKATGKVDPVQNKLSIPAYASNIAYSGKWVNDRDEGLMLLDGEGRMVTKTDGTPVKMTWDEIKKEAKNSYLNKVRMNINSRY